jgi:glycosyl transferase family 2
VCIPAWRAEPFIERTLQCAAGQTHSNLQIIVSVDRCDDRTSAICKSFADADSRIELYEQPQRLGWAGNVNFLLDKVRSPFFFLYFHDDIIRPNYTECLLKALKKHPEALSAHCDMGHFGGSEIISKGRNYLGSGAQRLAALLVAPGRGSPLRGLTRDNAIAGGLRMPTAEAGFWANEPYLLRLLALGSVIRVPQVLYFRWDQRSQGLTDGWKNLSPEHALAGFRANFAAALTVIDEVATNTEEREALIFCLCLQMSLRMQKSEPKSGPRLDGENLHPAFFVDPIPQGLSLLGPEITGWAMQRHRQLAAGKELAVSPEPNCPKFGGQA